MNNLQNAAGAGLPQKRASSDYCRLGIELESKAERNRKSEKKTIEGSDDIYARNTTVLLIVCECFSLFFGILGTKTADIWSGV